MSACVPILGNLLYLVLWKRYVSSLHHCSVDSGFLHLPAQRKVTLGFGSERLPLCP